MLPLRCDPRQSAACCRLSVAECGRVQGLYLTKQLFLAMTSVCLMLAADRANVVSCRSRRAPGQAEVLVCIAASHLHGSDQACDSCSCSVRLLTMQQLLMALPTCPRPRR